MRRRRLRKQKPPKRRAAAKAAKETEKADAVEKALQEEANERNHAFDNEKRSDLENMKAGAKHVGSNICIPKGCPLQGRRSVRPLCRIERGRREPRAWPFKTSPAAGTVGVFVTVQFENKVTVARCSILRHHLCLQGTGPKNNKRRTLTTRAFYYVLSVTARGGIQVVCASQKTPVVVDALENAPVNIRSGNFCINS